MAKHAHSQRLPNYLRRHRRRLALSQEEVAFLLGVHSGSHVSRYEHFVREPTLATAFAFEVIFQVPAKELFAGVYRKIEKRVATQAHLLARRADSKAEGAIGTKRAALGLIISRTATSPHTS